MQGAKHVALAVSLLAGLSVSFVAAASDRKIVWRMVSTWTVVGGSAALPSRYERSEGNFETKTECLGQLEQARDRLEADRAEAEQKARNGGATDIEYRATNECAPRYFDTSP